jgi:hypothetical protein
MHSLGRLIVESAIGSNSNLQFHPDSTLTAGYALVDSFAPEFRLIFGQSLAKIWIALRSTNQCLHISTQQIMLLQTAPEADVEDPIRSANRSARVAIIVPKLETFFRNDGIACPIKKGRIYFIYRMSHEASSDLRTIKNDSMDHCLLHSTYFPFAAML